MAKFSSASVLDGGSDLIRTLAATAARVKMHLIKAYVAADSYATVIANSLGSVDLVAGDLVQSSVSLDRRTTVAAKAIAVTASSAQYDQGTATSGGATTLTDTGKSFGVNVHANRALNIVAGTGSGQTRTIVSNTATVITVDAAWGTNPDSTSQYVIRDNLHLAVVDSTGSVVLLATDETTNQVVASGNTFNAPAWTYTCAQPT